MKINKVNVFRIFVITSVIILSLLSCISNKFELLIIIFIFIGIPSLLIYKNPRINPKLYLIVAILMIPLVSLIYVFLSQHYELINDKTYLYPMLVGVICVFETAIIMKYSKLREAIRLIGQDKYEESLDIIEKFLKSNPENYAGIFFKAHVFGSLKRYQEQLDLSNILIEKNKTNLSAEAKLTKKDISALNIKIGALLKLKRHNEAEELIEKILEKEPKNASTLANKAFLLSESGNYDEAIDYYEDALELLCKNINELENSREGKNLSSLIPLDHGLEELLIEMGNTYEKLQEYEDALSCYDEALEIKPEDKEALKAKEEVLKLIERKDDK